MTGYNNTKLKFSLHGLSITSQGQRNTFLKKTKENYEILEFPDADLKNMFLGEKYLFFRGNLRIQNAETKDLITINFPGLTWTGQKNFQTQGQITDSSGKTQLLI